MELRELKAIERAYDHLLMDRKIKSPKSWLRYSQGKYWFGSSRLRVKCAILSKRHCLVSLNT